MRDFTLNTYRLLLNKLIEQGYAFVTHAQYAKDDLPKRFVMLRHDVDRLPTRSLAMAKLEAELQAPATYYFRTKPASFKPDIMRKIKDLGHEIGYHYENLADTDGDRDLAWQDFKSSLAEFECVQGVKTIAMHGRPLSKWDNRDLWESYDYKSVGILLEPYKDIDWSTFAYFTDTGRCWNSAANQKDRVDNAIASPDDIRTTFDLIDYVGHANHNIVISSHPERWTNGWLGWAWVVIQDYATNVIKTFVRQLLR